MLVMINGVKGTDVFLSVYIFSALIMLYTQIHMHDGQIINPLDA